MAEENKKRSNKENENLLPAPFPSKEESTCLAQC